MEWNVMDCRIRKVEKNEKIKWNGMSKMETSMVTL